MGQRRCATTLEPEMTDLELAGLRDWLGRFDLKGKHLEVGTAAGGTLCFLMNCYEEGRRPPFVVVDRMTYFEDQMGVVERNLIGHDLDARSVDFNTMSSSEAFEHAHRTADRFDFILIDAAHKIRHVMADLRWLRLLNVGGIACFHDYAPRFKGVQWPIDRFLNRNPHFSRVGQAGTLLCIRRDAPPSGREVTMADRIWSILWSPVLQLRQSICKRLNRGDLGS
ncbi:MAG: class I SAM-dependent methyltransferase [Phycisphaerales bacterium]|jgi:hypothetical protein|nr:class I SAM-dependent methyltransferase [Phycisphaerales bacterium]